MTQRIREPACDKCGFIEDSSADRCPNCGSDVYDVGDAVDRKDLRNLIAMNDFRRAGTALAMATVPTAATIAIVSVMLGGLLRVPFMILIFSGWFAPVMLVLKLRAPRGERELKRYLKAQT